jgi:hypothetical protein
VWSRCVLAEYRCWLCDRYAARVGSLPAAFGVLVFPADCASIFADSVTNKLLSDCLCGLAVCLLSIVAHSCEQPASLAFLVANGFDLNKCIKVTDQERASEMDSLTPFHSGGHGLPDSFPGGARVRDKLTHTHTHTYTHTHTHTHRTPHEVQDARVPVSAFSLSSLSRFLAFSLSLSRHLLLWRA